MLGKEKNFVVDEGKLDASWFTPAHREQEIHKNQTNRALIWGLNSSFFSVKPNEPHEIFVLEICGRI